MGKSGYLFEIRRNPPKVSVINRSPANEEVDFSLFWEVWDLVDPIPLVPGAREALRWNRKNDILNTLLTSRNQKNI